MLVGGSCLWVLYVLLELVFLFCQEFSVGCAKECELLCGVCELCGVLLLCICIDSLWGMATLGVQA